MKIKAFTLIELLVVIAIIGILATVISIGYTTSQGRARDSIRRNDLATLKKIVDFYMIDNNQYPKTNQAKDGSSVARAWFGDMGTDSTGYRRYMYNYGYYTDNFEAGKFYIPQNLNMPAITNYIDSLPIDSKFQPAVNVSKGYLYTSDGNSYKILAYQTVEKGAVPDGDPMKDPARTTQNTFAVWSINATTW